MATYVMLTKVSPDTLSDPQSYEALGRQVIEKIKAETPQVNWLSSYSVFGHYDYVDVFEAPDNKTAHKVSVIVRSISHASTEIWPAASWDRFREMIQTIN